MDDWNDPKSKRVYLRGEDIRWILLCLFAGPGQPAADDHVYEDGSTSLGPSLAKKLGGYEAFLSLWERRSDGDRESFERNGYV